jgi:hypothetical protein
VCVVLCAVLSCLVLYRSYGTRHLRGRERQTDKDSGRSKRATRWDLRALFVLAAFICMRQVGRLRPVECVSGASGVASQGQWPHLLSHTNVLLHLLSRAAVCATASSPKQPVGSHSGLSIPSCISDDQVGRFWMLQRRLLDFWTRPVLA